MLTLGGKAVDPDKYPLPTVEELSAKLHGSTVFSKLDLRQGYLQVPLHPDRCDLTSMGVFHFTRMPFGLNSAPCCFHNDCLFRVFDMLTRHNLTLNGEKCIFAAPVIEFVGFRLTADGLGPLHWNTDAMLRLPEPFCPAQLSSFLGMTAYYLRFLLRFSDTTAPLRVLLGLDPCMLHRSQPAEVTALLPTCARPLPPAEPHVCDLQSH